MHTLMINLVFVRVLQGLLAFTTVGQGTIGQIVEPREAVVRTDEAWELLWSENSPQTTRLAVDFSHSACRGRVSWVKTDGRVYRGGRPGYAGKATSRSLSTSNTYPNVAR